MSEKDLPEIHRQLNLAYHGVKVSERRQLVKEVVAWLKEHREELPRPRVSLAQSYAGSVCAECRAEDHAHCTERTLGREPANRIEDILYSCLCECDKDDAQPAIGRDSLAPA